MSVKGKGKIIFSELISLATLILWVSGVLMSALKVSNLDISKINHRIILTHSRQIYLSRYLPWPTAIFISLLQHNCLS